MRVLFWWTGAIAVGKLVLGEGGGGAYVTVFLCFICSWAKSDNKQSWRRETTMWPVVMKISQQVVVAAGIAFLTT